MLQEDFKRNHLCLFMSISAPLWGCLVCSPIRCGTREQYASFFEIIVSLITLTLGTDLALKTVSAFCWGNVVDLIANYIMCFC